MKEAIKRSILRWIHIIFVIPIKSSDKVVLNRN
jgi:hypothetical protein